MLLLLTVSIGLVVLPRPATILLPTYANSCPDPLPIPEDVGWLTYAAIFLDQWLMLTQLPFSAKALVLILAFTNWVVSLILDLMLINRWREEERKELRASLLTSGGPIPKTTKNISVFHVLWSFRDSLWSAQITSHFPFRVLLCPTSRSSASIKSLLIPSILAYPLINMAVCTDPFRLIISESSKRGYEQLQKITCPIGRREISAIS